MMWPPRRLRYARPASYWFHTKSGQGPPLEVPVQCCLIHGSAIWAELRGRLSECKVRAIHKNGSRAPVAHRREQRRRPCLTACPTLPDSSHVHACHIEADLESLCYSASVFLSFRHSPRHFLNRLLLRYREPIPGATCSGNQNSMLADARRPVCAVRAQESGLTHLHAIQASHRPQGAHALRAQWQRPAFHAAAVGTGHIARRQRVVTQASSAEGR